MPSKKSKKGKGSASGAGTDAKKKLQALKAKIAKEEGNGDWIDEDGAKSGDEEDYSASSGAKKLPTDDETLLRLIKKGPDGEREARERLADASFVVDDEEEEEAEGDDEDGPGANEADADDDADSLLQELTTIMSAKKAERQKRHKELMKQYSKDAATLKKLKAAKISLEQFVAAKLEKEGFGADDDESVKSGDTGDG
jgi:hypothetical protein